MKILIPGVKQIEKCTKTFQCRRCGCVFEADLNEYYTNSIEYLCNCPYNDCGGVGCELTDNNMLKAMILQRDKVNKEKGEE